MARSVDAAGRTRATSSRRGACSCPGYMRIHNRTAVGPTDRRGPRHESRRWPPLPPGEPSLAACSRPRFGASGQSSRLEENPHGDLWPAAAFQQFDREMQIDVVATAQNERVGRGIPGPHKCLQPPTPDRVGADDGIRELRRRHGEWLPDRACESDGSLPHSRRWFLLLRVRKQVGGPAAVTDAVVRRDQISVFPRLPGRTARR